MILNKEDNTYTVIVEDNKQFNHKGRYRLTSNCDTFTLVTYPNNSISYYITNVNKINGNCSILYSGYIHDWFGTVDIK